MATSLEQLREKLESERKLLLEELSRVGRRNPENPEDWEPKSSDLNIPESDWNERADQLEDFGEHNAIEVELEEQLHEVESAIKRIDAGSYGLCAVCGAHISNERLFANPAANTCTQHM